jgi:hypothetical protein
MRYQSVYPPSVIPSLGLTRDTKFTTTEIADLQSFNRNYNKPIKFDLKIYSIDGELLTEFNQFAARYQNQEINLFNIQVNEAQDQTGDFSLAFFDHENNIDQSKMVEGCKVIITMGRDYNFQQPLMWGVMKNKEIKRGRMDETFVTIGGVGSEIILADAQTSLVRQAEFLNIGTGVLNDKDESMFANNILLDFFENVRYMQDIDISLRDRGQFDLSLLEKSQVVDFLGSIKYPDQDALSTCRGIADLTLSYFKVNAANQPTLEYGNSKFSGVTLKQYVASERPDDLGVNTSYFRGEWSLRTAMEKTLGNANILISETGKLRQPVSSSSEAANRLSLFNKDLAQSVEITNSFQDLTLLMSKLDEGSFNLTTLHGHIVADKNGLPAGSQIISFDIPLADIADGTQPAPVTIPNLNINENLLTIGKKVWIVFYEIGDSENRTVFWYHNGIKNGTTPPSAIRPLPNGGNNRDHTSSQFWELMNQGQGPTFAYSLFNTRKFRAVITDPISIAQHGIISARFDVPWTDDLITTVKSMNATIFYTAKRRMDYSINEVFIPEDYYFPVGDVFRIIDPKSGHTTRRSVHLSVYQRRIGWDAFSSPHGIHTMAILPYSYYNPVYDLLDNLNRDDCEC